MGTWNVNKERRLERFIGWVKWPAAGMFVFIIYCVVSTMDRIDEENCNMAQEKWSTYQFKHCEVPTSGK